MTTQRSNTPARYRVGLRLTEAEHTDFAAAALGAGFASPTGEGAIGPWLRSLGARASQRGVPHPKATTDPLLQEWRERRVWDTIPADRRAIARALGAAAALRPVVAIGPPEKRWWCLRSDGKGGAQVHTILTPPTGPDEGWRYFADGTYRVPATILSELVDGEFVVAEACP